jgi:DNA (cytosine-5)-methyltransferase 1
MFPYRWYLADAYAAQHVTAHGCKVFGTFVCGGGSTMGYKLAGFTHLGGVEIDATVASIYKHNHSPEHLYIEDIRHFNARDDLPKALYNLDILDGSPPCSSFSMAGSREKGWGKEKVFREGQTLQRLDDLVFAYVETIKKLQPRVAILENVKGLLTANGGKAVEQIASDFAELGYIVDVDLYNFAHYGVPQLRERIFIVGVRADLDWTFTKPEPTNDAKNYVTSVRLGNENVLLDAYRSFLSIPNVTADMDNIKRNASWMMDYMEASGIQNVQLL